MSKFLNTLIIGEGQINFATFERKKDITLKAFSSYDFNFETLKELESALMSFTDLIKKNPITNLIIINEEVIKNILTFNKSDFQNLKTLIYNDLKNTMGIDILEYFIDYEVLVEEEKIIVFVAAIPKSLFNEIFEYLKKFKLKLIALETDLNALKRFSLFLTPQPYVFAHLRKNECIILIVENNFLFTKREIKYGLNQMVDILENDFSSREEAEKNLIENGPVDRFTEIFDRASLEIQRSIDYYNSFYHREPVKRIFLSGEFVKINNLEDYIAKLFNVEAQKFDPIKIVNIERRKKLKIEEAETFYFAELIGGGLRNY